MGVLPCWLGSRAGGNPVTGNWEDPIPCQQSGSEPGGWPTGSMHIVQVPFRETDGSLGSRILTWYAPGCAYPNEGAPLPACEPLTPAPPTIGCPVTPPHISARLWNPTDGSNAYAPTPPGSQVPECGGPTLQPAEILRNCQGQGLLPDGRVIVVGGGCSPAVALNQTLIFNPFQPVSSASWTLVDAAMTNARWYPTCTSLADGRVLVSSGTYPQFYAGQCSDTFVSTPEVFDLTTREWKPLLCLDMTLQYFPSQPATHPPYYPFLFLVPGGELFFAGSETEITYLSDLSQTPNAWVQTGSHGRQLYGEHSSAVMYRPGKILKYGGYVPDTESHCDPRGLSARIDLTVSSPQWTEIQPTGTPPVPIARKDHNLVLLPDGTALAVGGSTSCEWSCTDPQGCPGFCLPVYFAELFDPDDAITPWHRLAAASVPRGYHSTAALLPDGRVLTCGGENWFGTSVPSSRSAQTFQPPYMFKGSPPVIDSITGDVENLHYGSTFEITVSGPAINPAKTCLLRLAAVTHGFDQNQRYVPLVADDIGHSTFTVHVPSDPAVAPPGYYMLFVVSQVTSPTNGGRPSDAKIVRIAPACPADLDHNCIIDGLDLAQLLAQWTDTQTYSPCEPHFAADLNGDCRINGLDLAIMLAGWGACTPCQIFACPPAGGGGGSSAPESGGGEGPMSASAASESGGPDIPFTGDPLLDAFLQWSATGDWDAFFQWLAEHPGGQ